VVSIESINYRTFGDDTAIIQSWHNSITLALPRNLFGQAVDVSGLRIWKRVSVDPTFNAIIIW
jgi:hypothetical protein